MRHKIIFSRADGVNSAYELCGLVRRAIVTALEAEDVYVPCEVSVLFTDNEGIREINNEMRGVDSATDVLSFPMYEFTPGEFEVDADMIDEESQRLPLGDMALSIDRIREQAKDFGHSLSREAAYLTVHSVLHLLGYDHLDEGEMKKQMRKREEEIMAELRLPQ
ncbi:MAG: rRNA maturation RNase YbeY [Oscillospiraceae bacterium]|nr:rRNA maturation RNase YbeY [Oscillospiraceae bacterium]